MSLYCQTLPQPQRGESNQMPWFGEAMHSCCWQDRVRVLGTPTGRQDVKDFLARKSSENGGGRSPVRVAAFVDVWCNTGDFLVADSQTTTPAFWQCMVQLMSVDRLEMSQTLASLPFRLGGMGLANAVRGREAAQWASWADCIKMVKQRHPPISATMMRSFDNDPG